MNIRWLIWIFVLCAFSAACNKSFQPAATRPDFHWEPGPSIPCEKVGDYLGSVLKLTEVFNIGSGELGIRFSLVGTTRYQSVKQIEKYIPVECIKKIPVDSLGVIFPQLRLLWDSVQSSRQLKHLDSPFSIAINCEDFVSVYVLKDSLAITRLPNETRRNP
jgi:hypothetical protein